MDIRGAIQLDCGGPDDDLAMLNEPLPSPFHSTPIAPFWDEIWPIWQNQSDVVWQVTGTAPNCELVVEWRDVSRSDQFCSCPAEIRILDATGRLVRSFTETAKCPAGGAVTSVAWDARNAARALVLAGTYTIDVITTDSAGNTSAAGRARVVGQ